MYGDSHVHLRDEEWAYKETIKHGLEVAEKAGVDFVIDKPNTKRPIITEERVIERFELANKCNSSVFYGVSFGLTANPEQIENAIKVYHKYFPKPGDSFGVVALKAFMGESFGDLEIKLEDQNLIYNVLSMNGYKGVLEVHCGRKDLMKKNLWNPKITLTHNYARPIKAKIESMKDQVRFARNSNFQGKLHFLHVSSPEEVEYIDEAKYYLSPGVNDTPCIKLSCEVTPHHLFLWDILMIEEEGILLKCNPPLRNRERVGKLFNDLKKGKIDTIATDHAPHSKKEKLRGYLSGIPGLDLWPRVAKRLKKECFSEEQIADLTFNNQVRLYGLEGVVKKSSNQGDEQLNEYLHLRPKGILKWI